MKDLKKTSVQSNNPNGLGVLALAAIVVSSMIGGGIYSLPQNMAAGASAGAVLLAWIITGLGIYFIARTFSILSMAKPDLKPVFTLTVVPVLDLMLVSLLFGHIGYVKFVETLDMLLLLWMP
jgi:hypothetical protein